MAENKGCGCGKKNVAPTPAPETSVPQKTESPEFRTSQVQDNGSIKKN